MSPIPTTTSPCITVSKFCNPADILVFQFLNHIKLFFQVWAFHLFLLTGICPSIFLAALNLEDQGGDFCLYAEISQVNNPVEISISSLNYSAKNLLKSVVFCRRNI